MLFCAADIYDYCRDHPSGYRAKEVGTWRNMAARNSGRNNHLFINLTGFQGGIFTIPEAESDNLCVWIDRRSAIFSGFYVGH